MPSVTSLSAARLAADSDSEAWFVRAEIQRAGKFGLTVSGTLPFVRIYQADGWTALGDPTRRAIFERLADHPWAVGELARELPISRPAVSQHLKVLKEAGLVVDRPDGSRRIYRLDPDGVGALRADLDGYWNKALATYRALVEQPTKEDR
jgi:DNA-binding transcriptional ArsR family regulator